MNHEYVPYGLALLGIFAGIFLNRQDFARAERRIERLEERLDARMTRLEERMQAGFDLLHRDMSQFARTIGQHDARLDALEEGNKSA